MEKKTNDSNKKAIFVICGSNEKARIVFFKFLRALNLEPLEWEQLVASTGSASPPIGEIIKKGFSKAQAAIVLLTPDEEVRPYKELKTNHHSSKKIHWSGQASQYVLIGAGMALALYPQKTIFVQLGKVRVDSSIANLDVIKLEGNPEEINNIAERLKNSGCPADKSGDDWISEELLEGIKELASPLKNKSEVLHPVISIETVPIEVSFLRVLNIAQSIHHEFHELLHNGYFEVGYSAKALFSKVPGDRYRELMIQCETRWEDGEDARKRITRHLFPAIQKNFEDIEKIIKDSNHSISGNRGLFIDINTSLEAYKILVEEVSKCFEKGILIDKKLDSFTRSAMSLNRAIDRIIDKSETVIDNLIISIRNEFDLDELGGDNDD